MRGDELLDALEHIEPELIEQAGRMPKRPWLRWTALAACLGLLIGLGALFLPGKGPDATVPTVPTEPVLPPFRTELVDLMDHTVNPEKLTGVQVLGSLDSGSGDGTQNAPPRFGFQVHLVVEARVVEILPDVYDDALTGYPYRILRLETLDPIVGQKFPKEFYLRLSSWMSSELDRFDSLILSLEQVGIENYMLVNQTTRTVEAFSMLFEVYNLYSPHYGSVVAFTDGVMDMSLWDLHRWGIGDYYREKILKGDPYMDFPAKEGSTPADTKETILQWVAESQHERTLTVDTQADFGATGVFDYVKPFENGVFAHDYYRNTRVRYFRQINGLHTTERILLEGSKVTYEGEAFTQEDLSALPDLCGFLEKLELEKLEQPHKEYYEGRDVWLHGIGATGMYAKVDGQLYGVIKVTWRYILNGVYDVVIDFHDALYYLVDAEGHCREAGWEELSALIGENEFLVRPTTIEELELLAP
jgi:hypothetical protein